MKIGDRVNYTDCALLQTGTRIVFSFVGQPDFEVLLGKKVNFIFEGRTFQTVFRVRVIEREKLGLPADRFPSDQAILFGTYAPVQFSDFPESSCGSLCVGEAPYFTFMDSLDPATGEPQQYILKLSLVTSIQLFARRD